MIADTSFLVSLYSPDDSNNQKAKKIYAANKGYILIPLSIFEETINVILYKKGVDSCMDVADDMLRNKDNIIYYPDEYEVLDVIDIIKRLKRKMSINDYEVAYLAAEKGEDLLCFDKQILSLANKLKKKK